MAIEESGRRTYRIIGSKAPLSLRNQVSDVLSSLGIEQPRSFFFNGQGTIRSVLHVQTIFLLGSPFQTAASVKRKGPVATLIWHDTMIRVSHLPAEP